MLQRLGERAGRYVVVLVLITLCTTLLLNLVPGNPALAILGADPTPEAIKQLNDQYRFDDPVFVRYWHWLTHALQGDLGSSPKTGQSVMETLLQRLPVTLELALLATILSLLLAIPLGLLCAYKQGSILDRVVDTLTSLFISVPSFVAAVLLVFVLAVRLNLLPVLGWVPFSENPAQNLNHAILPVLALALPEFAVFQRVLRTDAIATLQSDHIALARAKGLSTSRILAFHTLRVSSYSLLTVTGLRLAHMVGGTVVVEVIFAVPGLGALLVTSVVEQDLITVQGAVLVIATAYLLINLLIDLTYSLLDPRVEA